MPIRVRVGVAIVQDGRILLVNHRRMGRSYWVLPGGALDAGESLPECAAREVREETGLDVTVDRLLYLTEVFPKDGERHTVDVIFLGHLADETQMPRAMAGWTIERPEFVSLSDLPGLLLLPPIADEILADAAAAFAGPSRYLQVGHRREEALERLSAGPRPPIGRPLEPMDARGGLGGNHHRSGQGATSGQTMKRSKASEEMAAFAVAVHVEVRPARQCPTCRRKWPFDWDYCPECAVWIRAAEATERLTRLVPIGDPGAAGLGPDGGPPDLAAAPDSLILACEVRCDSEQPSPAEIRRGAELLRAAAVAIAAHGGTAQPVPGAGVAGCWASGAEAADAASRAAAAILQGPASSANGPRRGLGVSLGIGIVAAAEPAASPGDPVRLAFRLASLAHPKTALVSRTVYDRTVDRFDYRGVGPVVPRSDPLPGSAFELLRPKPERSGTHHVGPERAPLVGRRGLLRRLHGSLHQVAHGQSIVLHLIGEPGAGKSKLLREWLAAAEHRGGLAGWIRMQAHGVPYGGYPQRAWGLLLASANLCEATMATSGPGALPGGDEILARLRRGGCPALIVVDDLHWVDSPSRQALGRLIGGLEGREALVILCHRPSFANAVPSEPPRLHRHLQLRGLGREEMRGLVEVLAARRGFKLPAVRLDEIAEKARGNPLYAEEAVVHLGDAGRKRNGASVPLPSSLPELLIQRIQCTLETTLPEVERQSHAAGLAFVLDRENTLRRLDSLEEQLAAWLDRFDVIEEEAPPVARRFLRGLEAIDGRLALLSLFLGRQRPHRHRLAQALTRLGGGHDRPSGNGKIRRGPES